MNRHVILEFFRHQPASVIEALRRANRAKACDCLICVETRAMLELLERVHTSLDSDAVTGVRECGQCDFRRRRLSSGEIT